MLLLLHSVEEAKNKNKIKLRGDKNGIGRECVKGE